MICNGVLPHFFIGTVYIIGLFIISSPAFTASFNTCTDGNVELAKIRAKAIIKCTVSGGGM